MRKRGNTRITNNPTVKALSQLIEITMKVQKYVLPINWNDYQSLEEYFEESQ